MIITDELLQLTNNSSVISHHTTLNYKTITITKAKELIEKSKEVNNKSFMVEDENIIKIDLMEYIRFTK